MNPRDIIRAKRDGEELTPDQLRDFVDAFLRDEAAPYQMSAFLMAVFLRGMTPEETAALTRIMVESGDRLDFPEIPGTKVDKHSTGGVGDLISLPLAPLVAACGLPVPMISGRGLGHTGGTLDKLESIPGLRTDLDEATFRAVLGEVGYVMGGQTERLAPADRRMYALRDVTATVESIPLIVSSILCKKVAEGISALVLDVKCGRGAFMKTETDALQLARELCRVGSLMGLEVAAFITDMDTPLGPAAGNAVEVAEAVRCLRGHGAPDLTELTTTLGAAMLGLGGAAGSWDEARDRMEAAVTDGTGMDRFLRLAKAQGGDPRTLEDPSLLPQAPVRIPVISPRGGYVADLDPLQVGEAVVDLGGGRRRAEDAVDPAVGILLRSKPGDQVNAGDTLAEVLAATPEAGETVARNLVESTYRIEDTVSDKPLLIKYLVNADGHETWSGSSTWDRSRH